LSLQPPLKSCTAPGL